MKKQGNLQSAIPKDLKALKTTELKNIRGGNKERFKKLIDMLDTRLLILGF